MIDRENKFNDFLFFVVHVLPSIALSWPSIVLSGATAKVECKSNHPMTRKVPMHGLLMIRDKSLLREERSLSDVIMRKSIDIWTDMPRKVVAEVFEMLHGFIAIVDHGGRETLVKRTFDLEMILAFVEKGTL